MNKSWLQEKNAAPSQVVLKRFTTAWDSLLTSITNESSDVITYTAPTSGFSVFAITMESTAMINKSNEAKNVQGNITSTSLSNASAPILIVPASANKTQAVNQSISQTTRVKPNVIIGIGLIALILVLGVLAYVFFARKKSPEYHYQQAEQHTSKAKEDFIIAQSHHAEKNLEQSVRFHQKAATHHRKAASHLRKTGQPHNMYRAEQHEEIAVHHANIVKHIKRHKIDEVKHELRNIKEKLKNV